jgi:NDP-sugar pyrophosphorylase family protein
VGSVVIDNGYWHDVGTIEEYEKLKQAGFEKHPSAPI